MTSSARSVGGPAGASAEGPAVAGDQPPLVAGDQPPRIADDRRAGDNGRPPPAARGGEPSGAPTPAHRGWNAGRSISVVAGSLLAVVAMVILVGGTAVLVANRTMRDNGYLTSPSQPLSSAGYAVVVGDVLLQGPVAEGTVPAQVAGTVRVRATPRDGTTPLFVGIGHAAAVDSYLAGVSRTLPGMAGGGARDLSGGAPSTLPAGAGVWEVQSSGRGEQDVFWTPQSGRWSMVLMNADGTGPVTASIDVGVSAPWLTWAGGLLVVAGVIVMVAAAVLIGVAVHRASRPR